MLLKGNMPHFLSLFYNHMLRALHLHLQIGSTLHRGLLHQHQQSVKLFPQRKVFSHYLSLSKEPMVI